MYTLSLPLLRLTLKNMRYPSCFADLVLFTDSCGEGPTRSLVAGSHFGTLMWGQLLMYCCSTLTRNQSRAFRLVASLARVCAM